MVRNLGNRGGLPTNYGENYPVVASNIDTAEIAIAVAFGVTWVSFMFVAVRNLKVKYILGVSYTLLIGALILVTQYGYAWDKAEVSLEHIEYTAFTPSEVHADIGLHLGLRGMNITMVGDPIYQVIDNADGVTTHRERIEYNERYSWEWAQGRFGFGPSAGRVALEYREGIVRGVPLPIIDISEYFSVDGERIRWGRFYRNAGYYAHILVWTAFALWAISVLTAPLNIRNFMWVKLWEGLFMISACMTWSIYRPTNFMIPLGGDVLKPETGWTFALALLIGLVEATIAICYFILVDGFPKSSLAKAVLGVNHVKQHSRHKERIHAVKSFWNSRPRLRSRATSRTTVPPPEKTV